MAFDFILLYIFAIWNCYRTTVDMNNVYILADMKIILLIHLVLERWKLITLIKGILFYLFCGRFMPNSKNPLATISQRILDSFKLF
jgi:hypothetical protein